MTIEIIEIEKGYAVKFPFDLKGNFKSVFKSAKWNPDLKRWELGPRSKKRLEQWAQLSAPAAEDIEAAESAELDAKELAELEAEIDTMRAAIYNARKEKATFEAARAKLDNARDELANAKRELEAEKAAREDQYLQAKALIENACDVNAIFDAHMTMKANAEKVGTGPRESFKRAKKQLADQQAKLHAIGFRSVGISALLDANFNRPDRDNPRAVSRADIFNLVEVEA